MGDEEQSQLALLLQVGEHAQDLRLDRDVEHRHRLVADEALRLEHERRRDRDPLALPSGELMRVALAEALRIQSDVFERALHPPSCSDLRIP